jgi:hypothetical protein
MVMILSALLELKSRQEVNYTQPFPQAPLDNDVFMKIPQGWHYDSSAKKLVQDSNNPQSVNKEPFIHLKRNLYGIFHSSQTQPLWRRKTGCQELVPLFTEEELPRTRFQKIENRSLSLHSP